MVSLQWTPCGDVHFPVILKQVLQWEGGLCDDPGDPQGLTNRGLGKYDGLTDDQIRAMTDETAAPIYKRLYWDPSCCALLPEKLADVVFNAQVNTGRAIKVLQQLVYSKEIDGVMGPHTLNDVKYYLSKHPEEQLVQAFLQWFQNFYEYLGDHGQPQFERGWLNRNEGMASLEGVTVTE